MTGPTTDPAADPTTAQARLLALIHRKPLVAGGIAAVVVVAIVLAVLAFRPDPAGGTDPGPAAAVRTAPAAAQTTTRPSETGRPASTPGPTSATPTAAPELVPPAEYSDQPRGNDSKAEARLVGVEAGKGKGGAETVTFSFAGKGPLPKYHVEYTDAVRLHPDDDPVPVNGSAYLVVSFELTDPNQAGRLAFPPSLQAGQPQIQEVLLYDNLARSLKFAIGLESKTRFRVLTPSDPTRLVIEVARS